MLNESFFKPKIKGKTLLLSMDSSWFGFGSMVCMNHFHS